ncbi:MAG: flagellar basal body-associated FliL family protein, partial [Rhodocyclaceae bacterium]|nr:flagellar basal body-associated FliL family protein [Rhodocyclaceae bacterium]
VLTLEVGEHVKAYMPEIRHKVLLILSSKKSAELATPQGVQKLSDEMRMTINKILVPPAPPPKKSKKKGKEAEPEVEPEETTLEITPAGPNDPVQAVLFTSFIIQ